MFKILLKACSYAPEQSLWLRQTLASRKKAFRPTTKVRRGHEFDTSKLLAFLRVELGESAIPSKDEDIQVQQFAWGQSNPTFRVMWGDDKEKTLVVRKQPPGKLLKGAHDVVREYTAMTNLRNTAVPVPTTRALCEDESIIGTKFFVYDYVPGRFFQDFYLSDVKDMGQRQAIYKSYAETLASLHAQPPSLSGLAALGSATGGGYLSRQVATWTKQYLRSVEAAPGVANSSMDRLLQVLPALAALPEVEEGISGSRVTHGDFRIDNCIFDADEPKVVAVLDWELCTIGHPLADLAYTCMPYFLPPLPSGPFSGFLGIRDLERRYGLPSLETHLSTYIDASSENEAIERARPHFLLFVAVSYFRISAILAGVYARSKSGQASAGNAGAVGALASSCADIALSLIQRHEKGEVVW